jgi:hypothetical protein
MTYVGISDEHVGNGLDAVDLAALGYVANQGLPAGGQGGG